MAEAITTKTVCLLARGRKEGPHLSRLGFERVERNQNLGLSGWSLRTFGGES